MIQLSWIFPQLLGLNEKSGTPFHPPVNDFPIQTTILGVYPFSDTQTGQIPIIWSFKFPLSDHQVVQT